MMQLILANPGAFRVRTENLGKRANESALEFKPDLILLDFCLLDTDGGTVAEKSKVREDPQHSYEA